NSPPEVSCGSRSASRISASSFSSAGDCRHRQHEGGFTMTSTILAMLIAAGSAQRYEGRVQRFDAKTGKIFLLMNDHSTGNWTLAPQAKVFGPNHKPSGRGAIRPGEQVQAAVSQDGSVQTVWIQESDWASSTRAARSGAGTAESSRSRRATR